MESDRARFPREEDRWRPFHVGLRPFVCFAVAYERRVRELRNQTSQVIDAVRAGERVTLTVHGEPIADIVPHQRRARWLSGPELKRELQTRAADPALAEELNELAGYTLDAL